MDFFVNMHDGINNHFTVNESPYAAEGVNWPTTMEQLAKKHCQNGPTGSRLEINAHGEPATSCLKPTVGFQNLPQFAQAVRRLLKPNGAIEILSCWVASFNFRALAELAQRTYRPGLRKAMQAYGADRIAQLKQVRADKSPTTTVKGRTLLLTVHEAIRTNEEFLVGSLVTVATPPFQPGTPDYIRTANGPLFCSRLAALTRCRVRAAMIPQAEEGEKSGNTHYATPFGNWEGHVLDFGPGGDVHYVGFNLPRPVFRTHDQHGDGPVRPS